MLNPSRSPRAAWLGLPSAVAFAISTACTGPTGFSSPTLQKLAGVWDETSCAYVAAANPHRTEGCSGPFGTVTADSTGAFLYQMHFLSSEDSLAPFPGHFGGPDWALTATLESGGQFRVQLAADAAAMTWSLGTTHQFSGDGAPRAATLTATYARRVPPVP